MTGNSVETVSELEKLEATEISYNQDPVPLACSLSKRMKQNIQCSSAILHSVLHWFVPPTPNTTCSIILPCLSRTVASTSMFLSTVVLLANFLLIKHDFFCEALPCPWAELGLFLLLWDLLKQHVTHFVVSFTCYPGIVCKSCLPSRMETPRGQRLCLPSLSFNAKCLVQCLPLCTH